MANATAMARPAWAGVPPRIDVITSDGPTTSTVDAAATDHSDATSDCPGCEARKNRTMRPRLPG